MADVRPFRGIRYNTAKIGNIQSVLAPPYDVISPQEQASLHKRDPHNVVHLILGIDQPEDNESQNKYTRAAQWLRDWLSQGILIEEKTPAFYVYDQTFPTPAGEKATRGGLCAILRLEPWEKDIVRPHELTLPGPKIDRLMLFRAAKANLCPILGLYADPQGELNRLLLVTDAATDEVVVTDEYGVCHHLRRILDSAQAEYIREFFRDRPILIADGHHRYETALQYRDELRAQSATWSEDHAANFILIVLINLHDPALTILPTHRVVEPLQSFDMSHFLKRLNEFFIVMEQPPDVDGDRLLALVKRHASEHAFGLVTRDRSYILLVKPESLQHEWLPTHTSHAYRELDVTLLHTFCIEGLLGGEDVGCRLTYLRDVTEGVASVRGGRGEMFFVLNPTRLEQVQAVAEAHERMPEKSTYFYPKPATGLVMRRLTGEERT